LRGIGSVGESLVKVQRCIPDWRMPALVLYAHAMNDRNSTVLPARTFSVTIRKDWQALYEQIWRPEFFPKWASGLAESELRQVGESWRGDGPEGPIEVRFTPHNDFGVMDHFVLPGDGTEVHVPLRVIQNGSGAEVMLTLFRQPGTDEERFAADARWINRDLKALKSLVEARTGATRGAA
jgi:hypothetical protein